MKFGWENPVWIGWVSLPFKNVVIFIDTNSGHGIEAWVHLNEKDMAKFESDKELLAYPSTTTLNSYYSGLLGIISKGGGKARSFQIPDP